MDGIQQGKLEQDHQQEERPPASQRIQRHLLRRIGRGFLVLIPLLITLLIVRYLVAAIDALLSPIVAVLTNRSFIKDIPGADSITWAVVIILTLAFFYLLGTLATGPALAEQDVRSAERDLEPDTGGQDHLQRGPPGDRDTVRPHAAKIQPRGVLGVAEAGHSSNGPCYRTVPSAR